MEKDRGMVVKKLCSRIRVERGREERARGGKREEGERGGEREEGR